MEQQSMNDNLEHELLTMIIESCNIEDISPEDVPVDAPLVGPESPLGLDSLDAVEIVVAVQKGYGVRIGGKSSSRDVLQSISALADFIRSNK
jgi:acyl carrier protein